MTGANLDQYRLVRSLTTDFLALIVLLGVWRQTTAVTDKP